MKVLKTFSFVRVSKNRKLAFVQKSVLSVSSVETTSTTSTSTTFWEAVQEGETRLRGSSSSKQGYSLTRMSRNVFQLLIFGMFGPLSLILFLLSRCHLAFSSSSLSHYPPSFFFCSHSLNLHLTIHLQLSFSLTPLSFFYLSSLSINFFSFLFLFLLLWKMFSVLFSTGLSATLSHFPHILTLSLTHSLSLSLSLSHSLSLSLSFSLFISLSHSHSHSLSLSLSLTRAHFFSAFWIRTV